MERLVTRFSRAAMMGLAFVAAWLPIGVIAGPLYVGELEPEHIGGPLYTGLVCGTVFSVLAGITSGRRLGDLSAYQAAAWGAMSGLFTGMLPFVLGAGGLLWVVTSSSQDGFERFLPLFVMGGLTGLGALTGLLLPSIARWLIKENSPPASAQATAGKP